MMRQMWIGLFALAMVGGCGNKKSKSEPAANAVEDAASEAAADEPADAGRVAEVVAEDAGGPKMEALTGRPDWVTTTTPMSASCEDSAVGLACVGVSPYSGDVEEGRKAARKAAEAKMVEELASLVGGKRKAATAAIAEAMGPSGPEELRPKDGGWYWEEYAKVDSDGTEFLGFQRLTVTAEVKGKLIELARQAAQ